MARLTNQINFFLCIFNQLSTGISKNCNEDEVEDNFMQLSDLDKDSDDSDCNTE